MSGKDVLLEWQTSDSRSGQYELRLKFTPYFQLSGGAVWTLKVYVRALEGSVRTLPGTGAASRRRVAVKTVE